MDNIISQAKSGGRHSGYYALAEGWTVKQLERAKNNYARQVERHYEKINNPVKYIPEWENLTPAHQRAVLENWQEDINRNRELSTIMEYLLRQKRGEES